MQRNTFTLFTSANHLPNKHPTCEATALRAEYKAIICNNFHFSAQSDEFNRMHRRRRFEGAQ